ncbi:hypothetical protein ACFLX4_04090 [Chloroflexota bacterium]
MDFTDRQSLLARRFEKLKGKYEYDVIVGLSGGKDSTYVLYQMVKKYGLKVLAATYDNGFLTDFARESVKRTVEKLGVDHFYHRPNWQAFQKYYQVCVQKLGDPCVACTIGGFFLAIKECYEKRIPFFVHGRTPFQMYLNFYANSNDTFLPLMKLNIMEHSFTTLARQYGMISDSVKEAVNRLADDAEEARAITDEFFVDSSQLNGEFTPELLAYFLFEEYDEERIKQHLADTIGWSKPTSDNLLGHYDCAIHDAAVHMFKEVHGVDMLESEVAVMVRFGKISRQRAEELIAINQPTAASIERSLDCLCASCGLNRQELDKTQVALREKGIDKFEMW